ncbi:MAG TPA: AI-2E family transporter [Stellaceae bacterium]|nr:AI-2E family transporter [Stellaceae bacterium]
MPDTDRQEAKANPNGLEAARAPAPGLTIWAVSIAIIAALYFGRELFVPLALAVLLSFALAPLVMLLRRWHFGRLPSVIATVGLAFLVIFAIGAVIGSQLTYLAENLPTYQTNVVEKIRAISGTASAKTGIVGRATGMLHDLKNEITTTPDGNPLRPPPARLSAAGDKPVPVEIHQPDPGPLQVIQNVVTPLLLPLTTTGIVIVFVVFFLLQREDLRDRFIRLVGSRDLRRTTEALDDAGQRLSRYLLAQTAVNTSFGTLVGLGLWLIGLPNPLLWGFLAMLLRFVPYIGAPIAIAFPAVLALAIDPGWSMLLLTLGLYLVAAFITSHLVEPWLYGRRTGLSAVAVVVAAAFWTWLWGPIGLLLSTPLTMCLVVLGRHVDRLEFLDVLLGNRPALALEESFYQRLLAGDPDEAAAHAEKFLKEKPLAAYYDDVAIKGLALAQLDVNRGTLDHGRRVEIKAAIEDIIDNLSEHEDSTAPPAADELPVVPLMDERAVLCIGGRGSLDEAAAALLTQLLERKKIRTVVVRSDEASPGRIFQLDAAGARIICLSYLEAGALTNARYLVRRLRRKAPHAAIILGLWNLADADSRLREAAAETGADQVVTSLQQAVDRILAGLAAHAQPAPPLPERRTLSL